MRTHRGASEPVCGVGLCGHGGMYGFVFTLTFTLLLIEVETKGVNEEGKEDAGESNMENRSPSRFPIQHIT